ncbi:hypothetical protein [Streptacidiphilus sp. MAP12-16]|uniref:hypothetical protein n=1 Tax=Streptacidiphilus sp. MAP12-16 TaxID=3156300 RepID=UPI0035126F8E
MATWAPADAVSAGPVPVIVGVLVLLHGCGAALLGAALVGAALLAAAVGVVAALLGEAVVLLLLHAVARSRTAAPRPT